MNYSCIQIKTLAVQRAIILALVTTLIIISSLLCKPYPTQAANTTRYVDATLGNDTWTGTVADGDFSPAGCEDDNDSSDCTDGPWKTVSKVNATTLGQGDKIYFKRGETWNEKLTVVNSGALGNPIVFGAYGSGNKPILDGQTTRDYVITFGALSYLTFENLQVQNAASRNIWSDSVGGYITLNGIDSIGGSTGIWIRSKSTSTYSNITVTGATSTSVGYGFYLSNPVSDITITNVTSTNNAYTGIGLSAIINLSASYLTAQNNSNFGIYLYSPTSTINLSNLTAGGGTGLGNTSYGIYIRNGYAQNFTLYNAVSSYNSDIGVFIQNVSGTSSSTLNTVTSEYNSGSGFYLTGVKGLTVINSISRYNTNSGSGFSFNIADNVTSTNNIANNNTWDGISFGGDGSNFIVDHCIAYANGTDGQSASGDGFTSHDTITNLKIYNSIAYNNKNSGVAIIGSTSGELYNSTFYNNGTSGFTRGGYWSQVSGGSGWTLNNNIFSDNYPYEFYVDSSGLTYTTANYNVYYHPDNDQVATLDDGSTNLSWTTYHTTNGYEVNSVYGDPLFNSTSTNDYSLQVSSSAIDMSTSGSSIPTTDYNSKQRYDHPNVTNTGGGSTTYYDAGAYEYVTPPTPVIQSSSHPSESSWYNDSTPDISLASNTSDTTHYHYLVNQTAAPDLTTVEAGTEDTNGSFTVPSDTINADGTWYIHMVAHNSDNNPSATYDTYTINYDATASSISAVSVSVSNSGATISWTTNENASSQVEYGADTSYGSLTTETDTSPQVTSHSINLNNLTTCVTYHYRLISKDRATNQTTSTDYSFNTTCIVGAPLPLPPSNSYIINANFPQISNSLNFSDGTLVKELNDPKVYLIKNNIKYWITSEEAFKYYQYQWNKIITTQNLNSIPSGENITLDKIPSVQISNEKFKFTKTLKRGDTDPEVKKLQQFLNQHGFILTTSGLGSLNKETNFFGILTWQALKRFQETNAEKILKPLNFKKGTGIFGSSTINFINENF